jgi:predicted alpha/beta hydrolase family esterase
MASIYADHSFASGREPMILTVPGLGNSGPQHWQSHWENDRDNCERVDLGVWDRPVRTLWVNKLNLAIRQYADRPVILVAHSLGCLAVAWWAQYERPAYGTPVAGALLVAPPEVDHAPLAQALVPFAPAPNILLPFPSIVVASRDDPYMKFERARRLATFWGSGFIDAGAAGHINADSSLGKTVTDLARLRG